MTYPSLLEALESRIAPALVVLNPIADIVVGAGRNGTTIELSQMFDPLVSHPGHTVVTFTLNFDADPATPQIEPTQFKLELFDDEAPLTVQNFLRYIEGGNAAEFVDTFFHRSVSNFVLQGGGFSATDISKIGEHIDTFSTVHNEFSAERSNLRGTIAMAKVATNENTASSEWFVNLADNSSNLDNQNGGFTVFGRVIEGMDVIDQIAALPKANFGGALGAVPVQKMNPDPDNNTNTPSPAPGKDNLIRVTDISIAPLEKGGVQEITYEVTRLDTGNKEVVGEPTILNGSELNLVYNKTQSGVATIQVKAIQGGEEVIETFTVTVRPNLIASVMVQPKSGDQLVPGDSLSAILVPGEAGKVKFVIKNNGGANFSGNAEISLFMSSRDTDDPEGTILDTDDDLRLKIVDSKTRSVFDSITQSVTVNSAGELEITLNVKLPTDLFETAIDDYRLLIDIKPVTGTTQELFTDDNFAVDGVVHVLTNQFGTIDLTSEGFGKRTNVKLNYTLPGSDKLNTLSLKGPGTGQVTFIEGDSDVTTDDTVELLVTGTTFASLLKATTVQGGEVKFSQIDITDSVGTVDFGIVDRPGNVSISAGAKSVIFGDISDDSHMTIGAPISQLPVSIRLGSVSDFSLEATQPIKLLKAVQWLDVTDPSDNPAGVDDLISVQSISSIKITGNKKAGIRGDFEANVETIASDKLSSLSVSGLVSNATIHTPGSIGKVVVGGLINSNIFAGTDERPDSLTDFETVQTIQSVTVKGVSGVTGTFVGSQVAASIISKISVRGVDATNATEDFGFVADEVGKYSRVGAPKKFSKLDAPATLDPVGDKYKLLIL
jgi:peptidyl-prolyl cis-trans isomerase A (cyclophilin A)